MPRKKNRKRVPTVVVVGPSVLPNGVKVRSVHYTDGCFISENAVS